MSSHIMINGLLEYLKIYMIRMQFEKNKCHVSVSVAPINHILYFLCFLALATEYTPDNGDRMK